MGVWGVGKGTARGLGDRGVNTSAKTFVGGDYNEELAWCGCVRW